MTPLEMIAEWRRGCSLAGADDPCACRACTMALIDSLEQSLRNSQAAELRAAGFSEYEILYLGNGAAPLAAEDEGENHERNED